MSFAERTAPAMPAGPAAPAASAAPAAVARHGVATSLAARLTAWYAASAFAIALVVTIVLYAALNTAMARQDDQFLWSKVQVIRGLLRVDPLDPVHLTQEVNEDAAGPHSVYARVLSTAGRSLYASRQMGGELDPGMFPAPVAEGTLPARGTEIRLRGGRAFRTASALAAPPSGQAGPLTIQVAIDVSGDHQLLASYLRWAAVLLLGTLVVAVVAGHRIAHAGMRPVRDIIRTADSVRTSNLSERIALAGLPAELHELATTFNLMLDRLEGSFIHLQQFSDDIAHELRTPVNNILGSAEVALGRARDIDEYRDVLASILEDGTRLARTVQALLFLARSESALTPIEREAVDVTHEMDNIRDFYEASASERDVALSIAVTPGLTASVNRTLFQRAVSNLVANSLAHTPAGGSVLLSAAGTAGTAGGTTVSVDDTGSGIAPEHLPHVFDRFYRADRSRSTTSDSLGLGLSIVKRIAALHGGAVAVESKVGRGTRVSIEFPGPQR